MSLSSMMSWGIARVNIHSICGFVLPFTVGAVRFVEMKTEWPV